MRLFKKINLKLLYNNVIGTKNVFINSTMFFCYPKKILRRVIYLRLTNEYFISVL